MTFPETKYVGRIWRQDGQTFILTFDESGKKYWKSWRGWLPIEQDSEDESMVQIFIDENWWRTYKTELEIQSVCEMVDVAFV